MILEILIWLLSLWREVDMDRRRQNKSEIERSLQMLKGLG